MRFHLFLRTIFLLHSALAYSMEIITVPDDLIMYNIGSRLNRVARAALRLTNKRCSELILPQTHLNKNYLSAQTAGDTQGMEKWRKQGGVAVYEEIYNLFIDDSQKILAAGLLQNSLYKERTFAFGVRQNNENFMHWLLLVIKPPRTQAPCITDSIILARQLGHSEIVTLLAQYRDYQAPRLRPIPYMGGVDNLYQPHSFAWHFMASKFGR